MSETPPVSPEAGTPVSWWRRRGRFGGNFLLVSIALHLFFGVGATYYVVQQIAAKRTLAFQAGPPNPGRAQRQAEHKVQVAKQKQTSSAPAPPKRVAVTGLAKVSLPEMPVAPVTASLPGKMSGMGGAGGFGLGPGTLGGGSGGAGGGGGGLPMFGLREPTGGGLRGTFYDLKQTSGGKPTNMTTDLYAKTIVNFVQGGWSEGVLAPFFKGPSPLYATQIFIPGIGADRGPAAFGLEKEVQPKMWVAIYKGEVIPPESGTIHFVGGADDLLYVRFGGKLVLDGSWHRRTAWKAVANYQYGYGAPGGFAKGDPIQVEAGKSYPMEVLIGEEPGGQCFFSLLIEKKGGEYGKDAKGNPLLPIFRLADVKPTGQNQPPHAEGGPVWRGTAAGTGASLIDQMRSR